MKGTGVFEEPLGLPRRPIPACCLIRETPMRPPSSDRPDGPKPPEPRLVSENLALVPLTDS